MSILRNLKESSAQIFFTDRQFSDIIRVMLKLFPEFTRTIVLEVLDVKEAYDEITQEIISYKGEVLERTESTLKLKVNVNRLAFTVIPPVSYVLIAVQDKHLQTPTIEMKVRRTTEEAIYRWIFGFVSLVLIVTVVGNPSWKVFPAFLFMYGLMWINSKVSFHAGDSRLIRKLKAHGTVVSDR